LNLEAIKKLGLGEAKEFRLISLIRVCERNHITYNLEKLGKLSRPDLVTLKHACLGNTKMPEWARDVITAQNEPLMVQGGGGELCQKLK